ncbi:MAG TPA: M1 family metallopeptidase [Acidimicrobiales bacterium]|nr:M1 family metallopeptidase [Acidimicrobiales bacterium]
MSVDRYRLPRTVVPVRYELRLEPDLDAFSFAGAERVEVEVREALATVVLNAAELDITAARLVDPAGRTLTGSVALDADTERATITLDGTADPGTWYLETEFTGTLNDQLAGFYRSVFTDADGRQRVIATTQFESTDARRAFPCWDEPDLKAVFAVTLVVQDGLLAVANGPMLSDEPAPARPGYRVVRFADTMKMSTYLVAFIVGPLVATDPVDVDGVPLRVVHVPGKDHLTGWALETGAHALRFFTDYFGIPYPGDKLDLLALPDFAFGAMENVGAVTFRETALLLDPDTGTRLEHERIADVVSHEIAHMWFGDLVTMKWWNGIWLNEAFASFMEVLSVDALRPEWDHWTSFGASRVEAQVVDATTETRPIEFPVVAPEDAEGMFDVLTYEKGASVVRMLEQYLGGERFRDGIRHYMQVHQYGNTETTDLWDAIEETTGEPVRSTMDSWIFQGGYPLVSVDVSGDGEGVVLTQRRFRFRPSPDDTTVRWQVPVRLRAEVDGAVEEHRVLLTEASATLRLGGKPAWVVVNAGGSGFYRTQYSPELLRGLTSDAAALSPIERVNLVSDTWAAVLAGHAGVNDFVDLAGRFADETDPTVWQMVLGPLGLFERVLPESSLDDLRRFVRRLATPAFDRVGWEPAAGESEKVGTVRALLVSALGGVGADEGVRSHAAELHTAYLRDRLAVTPDLVPAIVGVVARNGGEGEYQQFLDRFRAPATPQEEVRYLMALAAFRHPGLIRRTLELAGSGEVRTQNAPYLINNVLANPHGANLAWDWLAEHWGEVVDRFPDNSLPRMLENISTITDPGLAARVREFLAGHPLKAGMKTVRQHLERMDVGVAFRERAGGALAAALRDDGA